MERKTMENKQNSSTYIFHYRDFPEWLKQSPVAFHLLAEFARRARRIAGEVSWQGENIQLKPREFITGRKTLSRDLGITEGQYRQAYRKLERAGLIKTIQATNRYTIGMYRTNNVFNINLNEELPTEQPFINHQPTTNNNVNNEKKDIYSFKIKNLTSKDGDLPCTNEELIEIAKDMNIPLTYVQLKHQQVQEQIKSGDLEINSKTYFTLRKFLSNDLLKGLVEHLPPPPPPPTKTELIESARTSIYVTESYIKDYQERSSVPPKDFEKEGIQKEYYEDRIKDWKEKLKKYQAKLKYEKNILDKLQENN